MNELLLSTSNLEDELPWLERFRLAPAAAALPLEIDRSSVMIVGNGHFSVQQGFSIDSMPIVARFNSFKTKGFEKFVGTKTTIHILNSQNLGLARGEHPGRITLLIDTSIPRKMYEFYFANVHRIEGLQIIRPSLYERLGRLLVGRYKTQGYFFVELARQHFGSVTIAGFSGTSHYFNPRWTMYTAHPLSAEHEQYAAWES